MALAFAGCKPPCRALAEEICACEPNQSLESACLQQLNAASDLEVSPEENEICEALLDTCTCEALDRDDFQQCGLSKRLGD